MTKGKLISIVEREGFIALAGSMRVGDALKEWRKLTGPARTSDFIYIVDEKSRLEGTVPVKELFLEPPEKTLESVMEQDFPHVYEKQSISSAASAAIETPVSEIPVLNKGGELIGTVSTNALLDALSWVNTKNIYNLAGILRAHEHVDLDLRSVLVMVRDRIVWLAVAVFLAVFVAGGILKNYEAVIVSLPAVTFFIPVLMGFGGNIGSQTSTIFVRHLAGKDPSVMRRLTRLLLLDFVTGAVIGLILGAFTAASAMLLFADTGLAMVLFISMWLTSVLAVLVGFLIPYTSHLLNLDPALVSGPVVTAIKDILALVIYFAVITALA